MRVSGLALLVLCVAAPPLAPAKTVAKPLLQGQYEAVSAVTPDGKTMEVGKVMLGEHGVWVRLYLIYDGDKLTQGTQRLELEDGVYRACEVAVSERITWNAKGYAIPHEASAQGRVTHFKTLTAKEQSLDTRSCSFSLTPETLELIPGDVVKLRASDGTVITLRPFSDDLDDMKWREKLPKKK